MAGILQSQAEMQGRLGTVAEVFGAQQDKLNQSLGQRLDAMTGRIGQTMSEQTRSTHESLAKLQERLAVIDTAQTNIQSLAGQVVQLQAILSNKQTRGAFGQARMEAIVADGLPQGAYEFQATLSNGSRPDCLIRMPNDTPKLVIDAKFPLESWNAIRAAEGADAQRYAAQGFRRDVEVHIRDIAEKYLIVGETQDTAFMFVPSESVFAEIHENFEAVVQRAHRARIVIVSPSLADAVDPGRAGDPEGCPHARAGASDSGRGHAADDGRFAPRRPRAQTAEPFRPGVKGHRGYSCVVEQGDQARAEDRGIGVRGCRS